MASNNKRYNRLENKNVKRAYRASHFVLWIVTIVSFTACSYFNVDESPKKKPVARAYDKYLYEDDVIQLIQPGTSSEDSLLIVKNFIDNWIKKNIVLHKAESNLADEEKNVKKQLDEYRNSLITYIYESELIRQKLDTVVSNEEIEKYYNNNPRNFELKENIVKAFYLKTKKDAPKLDKLRKWYKSNTSKDRLSIEEYCHQFALDFNLDDESWVPFDELLKKVPVKTYDKEEYLKNNRFIEIADSNNIYFVHIKGFMIKESLSPLSFEKDNIKDLIINKRKLLLVQEMERVAYDQALKNNDFEIYSDEKKKK